MTMPEKLYVTTGCGFEGQDILIASEDDLYNDSSPYIRADIAEDLALELEYALDILKFYHADHDTVEDALARFRAITP